MGKESGPTIEGFLGLMRKSYKEENLGSRLRKDLNKEKFQHKVCIISTV